MMNFTFQNQLNRELLKSEKKRTLILIGIFSFAILFRLVDLFLLNVDEESLKIKSMTTMWVFPFAVILFEGLSYFYIDKRLRKNKGIPKGVRYVNTAVEICVPSTVILLVARQYPAFNVLQSPVINIYFIFIILSTLRLNFVLSFFCGALAASSFSIICIFVYGHFNSADVSKAIIILFNGVAAGLVAQQIKASIGHSLRAVEKQEKLVTIFGKQVSNAVAKKMLENDGKVESSRMNVAVMFIDIRNFTNYVADKTPEEIVQYQNRFFSIVVNAVERHHGIVNQFLGDGCMITFGAPHHLLNPSKHAVQAAQEVLSELENTIDRNMISPTRIGIGIHAGEVVTGNIGTADRQQYSITGNVVILAARIEQLNKQFQSQILISRDVYHDVGSEFLPAEPLGEVELKGWHQSMSIYKIA